MHPWLTLMSKRMAAEAMGRFRRQGAEPPFARQAPRVLEDVGP